MKKQDLIHAGKIAGGALFMAFLFLGIDALGRIYFFDNDPAMLSGYSRDLIAYSVSRYSLFVRFLFLLACIICGTAFFYYSKRVQRSSRRHQACERRFRSLMNSVSAGAAVINEKGRIQYVNEKLIDMTGLPSQEIINSTASHFLKTIGALQPSGDDAGLPSASSGLTLKRHGTQIYASITRQEIRDAEGRCAGETIILTDDSRLTQMSEEIQGLKQTLKRSKKMETLGKMTGRAAHDLNNILSGIISYPELLLNDLPKESPLKKTVLKIRQAGLSAADTVSDLLSLARGEYGLSKKPVRLDLMIREHLESREWRMLQMQFPGVDIRFENEKYEITVDASSALLIKVIKNLLLNAVESVRQHGVIQIELRSIDAAHSDHAPALPADRKYAVLSVSDSGPQIAAADLEQIFEPFYTKKKMGRGGTGLGLTMVRSAVQDHLGAVTASSSPEGSRFDVYLPLSRKKVHGDGAIAEGAAAVCGSGETVVVVDDEEVQREIASAILEKLQYTPVAFQCGEEAITHLREHSADLLVLDLMMEPHISGFETYKEVISFRPHQKAIIVSGFIDLEAEKKARRLGISTIIEKPYNLESLGRAIQKELCRHITA